MQGELGRGAAEIKTNPQITVKPTNPPAYSLLKQGSLANLGGRGKQLQHRQQADARVISLPSSTGIMAGGLGRAVRQHARSRPAQDNSYSITYPITKKNAHSSVMKFQAHQFGIMEISAFLSLAVSKTVPFSLSSLQTPIALLKIRPIFDGLAKI